MTSENIVAARWYDRSYSSSGFSAQRRYPNEELLRFLGRNYFHLPINKRKSIRALEVGCGSGANIWTIAREGFDTFGLDLSPGGIDLCTQMLGRWGTTASLEVGDMTAMPYPNHFFDIIVDVFSSNCLTESGFAQFLQETHRLLKPNGRFFVFTPSKASDAFKHRTPSTLLDPSTLNGIRRETSPYFGNSYPFRFITTDEMRAALMSAGLTVTYLETVGRTYRGLSEYFEFVVAEATKSDSE